MFVPPKVATVSNDKSSPKHSKINITTNNFDTTNWHFTLRSKTRYTFSGNYRVNLFPIPEIYNANSFNLPKHGIMCYVDVLMYFYYFVYVTIT